MDDTFNDFKQLNDDMVAWSKDKDPEGLPPYTVYCMINRVYSWSLFETREQAISFFDKKWQEIRDRNSLTVEV